MNKKPCYYSDAFPIRNQSFGRCIDSFEQLIRGQGYSGPENMLAVCKEFFCFIEQQRVFKVGHILPAHITAYRDYLNTRPNQRKEGSLSESVIRRHQFVLRLLFDHLMEGGLIEGSPVSFPRQRAPQPTDTTVYSQEEIGAFYKAAESEFEKALLALAYGCGLRKTEIVKLRLQDIDLKKGSLTVRAGKFGKTRTVPIADTVLTDLRTYAFGWRKIHLEETRSMSSSFLLNNQGTTCTGWWLNYRLKRMAERSTHPTLIFKQVSLHALRRSISTHLIDQGADIYFVQRFLGHVMLDTTHLYSRKRKLKERFLTETFDQGKTQFRLTA